MRRHNTLSSLKNNDIACYLNELLINLHEYYALLFSEMHTNVMESVKLQQNMAFQCLFKTLAGFILRCILHSFKHKNVVC